MSNLEVMNESDSSTSSSIISYSYEFGGCLDFSQAVEFALEFVHSYSEKIVLVTFFPIIIIIGLLLNVWFLFAVVRLDFMRTSLNYYLVNLACVDIMILTINTIDKPLRYAISPVPDTDVVFGKVGCIMITHIQAWGFFTSLSIITLVAFEKCFAVCKPLKHKHKDHKKRAMKLCFAAWLMSFLLAVVNVPSSSKAKTECIIWPEGEPFTKHSTVLVKCEAVSHRYLRFTQIYTSIPFFVGFVVNTVLYVKILMTVMKTVNWRRQTQYDVDNRKTEIRVARMLLINGLVYFCCLAPNQLVLLLTAADSFSSKFKHAHTIKLIANVLIYLNSTLNPIVFSLTDPRYRLALILAVSPRRFRRRIEARGADFSRTSSTAVHMHSVSNSVKTSPAEVGLIKKSSV